MATVKTVPFELVGADKGPLRGEVRTVGDGGARPAVVICHGFKGFKDWGFFPHLAQRIANAGITTVSFNFSGSGIGPDGTTFSEPDRFGHATHTADVADLATVVDALKSGELAGLISPRSIGVFGHSRGGGTAVLYGGAHPDVGAMVTWNAIGTVRRWPDVEAWRRDGKIDIKNARTGEVLPIFEDLLDDIEANANGSLDVVGAAGRVEFPWLIVHGEADEAVSIEDGKRLYEASGAQTKLQVVKDGTHVFGAQHPWEGCPPELHQAMDITAAWFSRHLK
jgi:pimeloyl-ACP methyl ester carboxylesterase